MHVDGLEKGGLKVDIGIKNRDYEHERGSSVRQTSAGDMIQIGSAKFGNQPGPVGRNNIARGVGASLDDALQKR